MTFENQHPWLILGRMYLNTQRLFLVLPRKTKWRKKTAGGLRKAKPGRRRKEINMAKRTKKLCVCSLVNKLILFGVHNLEGEIYFKHSPKCKSKTSGTYE